MSLLIKQSALKLLIICFVSAAVPENCCVDGRVLGYGEGVGSPQEHWCIVVQVAHPGHVGERTADQLSIKHFDNLPTKF